MPADRSRAQQENGLQINTDARFERRTWAVQRAGWLIGTALLVAAALGCFGSGPLSRSAAGEFGTFWIEYDRFARVTAPTELTVHIEPAKLPSRQLRLILGEDYIRSLQLESAMPRIAESSALPDGVLLAFDTDAGPDAGPGIVTIVLVVKFTTAGRVPAEIGLQGGPRLRFVHWIFP